MKQVVVGDVHGNTDRFLDLMEELQIPKEKGQRANEGIEVIQLGDFLNLGYGQEEYDFWLTCRPYLDVYLMGNHELPVVAPHPYRVSFMGFEDRDHDAVEQLELDVKHGGMHGCAYAVGDWLITHAGVTKWADTFIDIDMHSSELAGVLNERYNTWITGNSTEEADDFIFENQNSIFWNRLVIGEHEAGLNPLKQIIGHTPQLNGSIVSDSLYVIDIGAKVSLDNGIAALVTEDDGKSWDLTEIAGVPA